MRSLVTGGAGFIGSHLVDRLLADRHEVIVVDSLRSGRRRNLDQHDGNPLLTFHEEDVREPKAFARLFEGVDWVFHLAALADIVPSIQQPEEYFTTNVDGTFRVLEAARAARVKRFLYAASSSCYGIPDAYPTSEEAPIRPQYPYALTKYLGECAVLHWGRVYGLPVVSLRLFNVYGPRSRTSGAYGAVFGVFIAQMLAGKPFTVVGDGTQTRDFTFVTDVAEAFVRSADSNASDLVLNVGSGSHQSVNRLVELLGGGDVVRLPKRPGEPDCTFADISQIRQALGWVPRVSLEEGVSMMKEHLEDWRDAPVWTAESIALATKEWFQCLGARR